MEWRDILLIVTKIVDLQCRAEIKFGCSNEGLDDFVLASRHCLVERSCATYGLAPIYVSAFCPESSNYGSVASAAGPVSAM